MKKGRQGEIMRRGYEEEKEDEEKEMIINERDVFLRYLCSLY